MLEQTVRELFSRFKSNNPQPATELVYHNTFELLIAVILSAQATDKGVNKATLELYKVANTPSTILDLGLERLKKYISSIGLYNTKAENILKTCKILVEKHAGQVPNQREALEALPGVGRKTANVILNTAFGQPTMAVDTHIFRIANRLGLSNGTTPLAVEQDLIKIIPDEYKHDAHHWLILHGRYVCVARNPKCDSCFVADLCETVNPPKKAQIKAKNAPKKAQQALKNRRKTGE
ncbi:MAG: endonuclease III [Pseudomonadota bacterium]